MNRINSSLLCCLIVLAFSIQPQRGECQGMGMGRMGGMGGGRGGSNTANDPPPEPEKPVVKFNPFAADAAPVQGLEARTAALEKFVFGRPQTNPKMKLRVQRLEKKLVPYEHHQASETDYEKRINHLWTTLEAGNNGAKAASPPSKDSDGKKESGKESGKDSTADTK